MIQDRPYFFIGIGGSGMLPLALILKARGAEVAGSDRSLDAGRTGDKFDFLRARGIGLFPQDGSGVTDARQIVVASAAVEDTVPDVIAARRVGADFMSRAQMLASLFNESGQGVAVGGTSGKSTTTGMIGWILHATGKSPTVMNGAVMKNFATPDAPFASALVGESDIFVSEVDESDGTISLYHPRIAVLNNIALDHKSMEELRTLFANFIAKAEIAILNLDNNETAALAAKASHPIVTYSLRDPRADLVASGIEPMRDGVSFVLRTREGEVIPVKLQTPGRHNVSNALAALAAARACGASLEAAAKALEQFAGVKRRMEIVGESGGVTVIDDFAHNPDKIQASLSTLHEFPGRLLVMFQPHGFGPLRQMKNEFIACFADNLSSDDLLLLPPPVYHGGTTDMSVGSADIVAGVKARGVDAYALESRDACGNRLLDIAKAGDRIIIMGARDDTLSVFARDVLAKIGR